MSLGEKEIDFPEAMTEHLALNTTVDEIIMGTCGSFAERMSSAWLALIKFFLRKWNQIRWININGPNRNAFSSSAFAVSTLLTV